MSYQFSFNTDLSGTAKVRLIGGYEMEIPYNHFNLRTLTIEFPTCDAQVEMVFLNDTYKVIQCNGLGLYHLEYID